MERNAAHRRRRVLLGHCVRGTGSVVLLTALYFLAPLEGGFGVLTVLTLVLGLVAFGLLTAWQVTAITRAEYPRLSALEAMATAVPLFLFVFSATYFMLSESIPATFSEALTRTDALYFTVTVFATVGFGDIVPVTGTGRVLTTVQMIADLVVVGVIAKALFGAMKIGMRRRGGERHGGPPFVDDEDA
ncbi:potassium channel family protein [Streptomyces yangpuensis]|uniref:Potassium channel family protein n=1 Tax=Streptomyces yangpuensis TaxID=1648182 RepID=A0ABY5PXI3_9ACTN|nr:MULTISPECIES: potassium channel family protein [Streptomyces]MBZ9597052.1 potassium channel family protein [Streptomyces erythrochromogenes]UUY48876.1 potassium channel family protein [Streptomyces yangpuensis]